MTQYKADHIDEPDVTHVLVESSRHDATPYWLCSFRAKEKAETLRRVASDVPTCRACRYRQEHQH